MRTEVKEDKTECTWPFAIFNVCKKVAEGRSVEFLLEKNKRHGMQAVHLRMLWGCDAALRSGQVGCNKCTFLEAAWTVGLWMMVWKSDEAKPHAAVFCTEHYVCFPRSRMTVVASKSWRNFSFVSSFISLRDDFQENRQTKSQKWVKWNRKILCWMAWNVLKKQLKKQLTFQ